MLPPLQEIMNNFMEDMFARIAAEAARLLRISKKETLSAREVLPAFLLSLRNLEANLYACASACATTATSTASESAVLVVQHA